MQAVERGDWLLLDELNLASSEVVECLNRILDDNRQFFCSETQEAIPCHPEFRLFATQNPVSYLGRNQLSDAILNRFVIFPVEQNDPSLQAIIEKKFGIAVSRSSKIIALYNNLQSI